MKFVLSCNFLDWLSINTVLGFPTTWNKFYRLFCITIYVTAKFKNPENNLKAKKRKSRKIQMLRSIRLDFLVSAYHLSWINWRVNRKSLNSRANHPLPHMTCHLFLSLRFGVFWYNRGSIQRKVTLSSLHSGITISEDTGRGLCKKIYLLGLFWMHMYRYSVFIQRGF